MESFNYYRIISLLLFVNHNGIWIWATPNIIIHMSQYCMLTRIADNWSTFSPRLRFLLKYYHEPTFKWVVQTPCLVSG